MVNSGKKLIIILAAFSVITTQSQARVVSYIDIQENGLQYNGHNDKNEKNACKLFQPTQKQLINYFNRAKEYKESGTLMHEYYSPCISIGTVKFQDGSTGEWTLQSGGLGYVTFGNGETTYFFYKDNKWTDPFACTYGLSGAPEC